MKIKFLVTCSIYSIILLSYGKGQTIFNTKDGLLGKWHIDSISIAEVVNNKANNIPTTIGKFTDYIEFKIDGQCYAYNDGTIKNKNYILLSDTTLQMDDSPVITIKELTKTKLYLHSKKVISATVYVENKYFFHK